MCARLTLPLMLLPLALSAAAAPIAPTAPGEPPAPPVIIPGDPQVPDFSELVIFLDDELGPGLGDETVPVSSLEPLSVQDLHDLSEFNTVRHEGETQETREVGRDERQTLDDNWVININTAPVELLSAVPLLDPLRAEAIVAHREANGPFRRPSEVTEVFGISEWEYGQLGVHLVCRGPSTLTTSHTGMIPASAPER